PCNCVFPRHLAPWLVDAVTHHGLEHALLVCGVTPRKAAFNAGMPAIGLAVFPGHHAHDCLPLHLGTEAAAHATIGTSRENGVLGLSELDDRFFLQGSGWAGLHTGATRHAFALQKWLVLTCGNAGIKSATCD